MCTPDSALYLIFGFALILSARAVGRCYFVVYCAFACIWRCISSVNNNNNLTYIYNNKNHHVTSFFPFFLFLFSANCARHQIVLVCAVTIFANFCFIPRCKAIDDVVEERAVNLQPEKSRQEEKAGRKKK